MKKIKEIIEKSRNLIKKVLFKARSSEKVQDIRRSSYTEGEVNGTNLGNWYDWDAWDPKGVEENE